MRLIATLLVAAIACAACGSSDPPSAASPSDEDAFDWVAPAVEGGEIDAHDLVGTPLVVWFWAPWCPTCNAEAADLAATAAELDDQATFVGIAGRDELGPMREFVDRYSLPFRSAVDEDGDLWSRFGVRAQPAFAFVAPDGSYDVVFGAIPDDELRRRVAELTPDQSPR